MAAKGNNVTIPCEVCGKLHTRSLSHYMKYGMRFCSRACQGVSKRTENRGELNGKYNQVELECNECHRIYKRKASQKNKSKYCSYLCRNRAYAVIHSGKGNPSYVHGLSNEPYPLEFTKVFKDKIIKRDGEICVECGISRQSHKEKFNFDLHVHHIDYNKSNLDEMNLCTLCLVCHGKTHKQPIENWIIKYQKYMKDKYAK